MIFNAYRHSCGVSGRSRTTTDFDDGSGFLLESGVILLLIFNRSLGDSGPGDDKSRSLIKSMRGWSMLEKK